MLRASFILIVYLLPLVFEPVHMFFEHLEEVYHCDAADLHWHSLEHGDYCHADHSSTTQGLDNTGYLGSWVIADFVVLSVRIIEAYCFEELLHIDVRGPPL